MRHVSRSRPRAPGARLEGPPPATARAVRSAPASPVLWLWAAFIVLFPFYLYESGVPKPADWLMVVVFALVFAGSRPGLSRDIRKTLLFLGWFVVYAGLVNWTWAILHYDVAFLLTPLYYGYNFLLFLTCLVLFFKHGDTFLRVTSHGVALSVLLQVGLAFIRGIPRGREELFFNNPNQLGYYAVLAATLFLFGTKRFRFYWPYQALVFGACLYLGAISLSKAAIGGLVLLGLVSAVQRPAMALTTVVLLWGSLVVLDRETTFFSRVEIRFETVTTDDNPAGRGYDRVTRHPEHLLLGAGEGGTDRFETEFQGEFHSTLGTALFSYGMIGFGLLLAFLNRIFRRIGFKATLYLMPIFLYGLTHNGLRFSLFWVTLGVALCTGLLPSSPRMPRRKRFARAPAISRPEVVPPRLGAIVSR